MSSFERYLTVWVAVCIVVGIALGHLLPGTQLGPFVKEDGEQVIDAAGNRVGA